MSNAASAWMHSVQKKYDLDGSLDTRSYYAGIPGVNIEGVEIRIFEETEVYTSDGPKTPTGDYKIIDAPFICQYPDWPTGCESVSAVMALNYIGNDISVDTFIQNYLDMEPYPADPNQTFVGNPYGDEADFGCYSPVIKKALDKILKNTGYYAKRMSGVTLSSLCAQYIDNNIPVILWATSEMDSAYVNTFWYYEGRLIKWIAPEHCLLLVGYDDKHYIFNDPQASSALTYYSKSAVEVGYAALNYQAVVILEGENEEPEEPVDPQPPAYQYGAVENPSTHEVYPIWIPNGAFDGVSSLYILEEDDENQKPTYLSRNSFDAAKFFSGLEFENVYMSNSPVLSSIVGMTFGALASFSQSWNSVGLKINYYKHEREQTGLKLALVECGSYSMYKLISEHWPSFDTPFSLKAWYGFNPNTESETYRKVWEMNVSNSAKALYEKFKGVPAPEDATFDIQFTLDSRRKENRYQTFIFFDENGTPYEYAYHYNTEKVEVYVEHSDGAVECFDVLSITNPVSKIPEDKAALLDIIIQ